MHASRLPTLLAALSFLVPLGCAAMDDGDGATDTPPIAIARTLTAATADRETIATDAPAGRLGTLEAPGGTHGIGYNGGPVMGSGVNVYLIWYGNWANNSATTIIPDWAAHIGGSPYYNINSTYWDTGNHFVGGTVNYAGSTSYGYTHGSALKDGDVGTIVAEAIGSNRLPADSNAVYFVLTSADVTNPGFCSSYCGWHTYEDTAGKRIKFAFIGNAAQCNGSCGGLGATPNGNAGADDMISVMTHELEEAASDPELNAWGDNKGENADKCAWTFGATYTTGNGAKANVKLGNRDYLIQQNWVNAGAGYCAMSFNSCGYLGVGQRLIAGQSKTSCDGRFTLSMQTDGNLVLYWNGHGATWASNTWGTTGHTAIVQADGNFVLYDTSNKALWASGTWGHPGSTVAVQNDGNLVVYDGGTARWASGTCCH